MAEFDVDKEIIKKEIIKFEAKCRIMKRVAFELAQSNEVLANLANNRVDIVLPKRVMKSNFKHMQMCVFALKLMDEKLEKLKKIKMLDEIEQEKEFLSKMCDALSEENE